MTTNKMTAYAMIGAILLIMIYFGSQLLAG